MRKRSFMLGTLTLALAAFVATAATGAEVKVMISGGLTAAYRELVPEFERATGHKAVTAYGVSMGTTPNAIPVRLARGEPADVLIMVGYALDELIKQGKAAADGRRDLALSPIGIAVRAGTPKPDISTLNALRRAAKSIPTAPVAFTSRPSCSPGSVSPIR
jgi:molybdate transport system substrate-binding protein